LQLEKERGPPVQRPQVLGGASGKRLTPRQRNASWEAKGLAVTWVTRCVGHSTQQHNKSGAVFILGEWAWPNRAMNWRAQTITRPTRVLTFFRLCWRLAEAQQMLNALAALSMPEHRRERRRRLRRREAIMRGSICVEWRTAGRSPHGVVALTTPSFYPALAIGRGSSFSHSATHAHHTAHRSRTLCFILGDILGEGGEENFPVHSWPRAISNTPHHIATSR
jgi:hypothetical protein